jgi:hypothetical protein
VVRVDAIRRWFEDFENYEWIIGQFGFDFEDMRAEGYMLAIEPIAYYRYQGSNYAFTATEAALFDQLANGALSSAMAPLTRKNLPLAIFLEEDEFVESPYRINEWRGTRDSNVPNSDIIPQLGIGYINYSSGGGGGDGSTFSGGGEVGNNEDYMDFSYPTDTWVITSFRLCNVRRLGSNWTSGGARTAFNPASARVTIDGTVYNIRDIYIPAGSEQLIWVKWKTPLTPGGKDTSVQLIGKGNKSRVVIIPEHCAALLQDYLHRNRLDERENKGKYVFSSRTHSHMTISCVGEIVAKYVKIAKAEHLTLFQANRYSPHSFRHSIAVHMLESGVPLPVIKVFLGHSSIMTTMTYATVSDALKDAYLKNRNVADDVMKNIHAAKQKPYTVKEELPFLKTN